MDKTISIIIPAYNYAKYLPECIESVLNQSVKAYEIIVVDDESKDNTPDVCFPYQRDGKIKYLWQKNKGLSGARNTGIKYAHGEYIMCLDADDILRPDAIKEHLRLADPGSVVTCGLSWFGSETGTFRPQGATLESLLTHNTAYCNSLFPKRGWVEVGGYDESDTMRLGLEDWLFWIELAGKGYKFKTNDYVALLYRKHNSNMTKMTTHPNWKKITDYMVEKTKHLRK